MGYSRFGGNQEEIMEGFLKSKKVKKSELSGYEDDVKSLIRKKMIACDKEVCTITDRGRNAIKQQIKLGEYWVSPLKSKPFEPYGKAKISRELVGYIK